MTDSLKFDHYEVMTHPDGSPFELGRGAMGITYKAFDTNLRVAVALKVINARFLDSEIARQRFVREARAAAQLRHANVASVFHLGSTGEAYFYAMEFVDGETVEALIMRTGPIKPEIALPITIQVTRALSAASKLELVHRDIKPANLMLVKDDDDYVVKVIDFGLAKSTRHDENDDLATLSMGGFVGTAHFASPEQLEEKEIDVRSDIYSLGVTLWYMLVGRAPFGGSIAQVMSQHLHRAPPMEQLNHVDAGLRAIVGRMIEKNPADRPQTPGGLRVELENCLTRIHSGSPSQTRTGLTTVVGPGSAVSATDAGQTMAAEPDPSSTRRPTRNLWPIIVSAVVTAIVVVGGLVYFKSRQSPPPVVSTSSPNASPVVSVTPGEKSEPTPSIAQASPSSTPAPPATQQELLKQAVLNAESLEAAEKWPDAIVAYAQVAKQFPQSDVGQVRLHLLLDKIQQKTPAMSDMEFDRMSASLNDAAKMDAVPAMEILADKLRERDPVSSFNWWCAAAARGQADAMRQVGLRYASGTGVERDLVKAARWFEFARQQGDTTAKTLLAECYLLGKGVTKDEAKAVDLLREAAATNDPLAMDKLANCYHKGIGVPVSDKEAFRLYSQAAKMNYMDSVGNLGVLYMVSSDTDLGNDKQARIQKAVGLFRQGAEQNNAWCLLQYARCLESGTGMTVDLNAARQWYRRAALAGSRPAQDWCRQNHVALDGSDQH